MRIENLEPSERVFPLFTDLICSTVYFTLDQTRIYLFPIHLLIYIDEPVLITKGTMRALHIEGVLYAPSLGISVIFSYSKLEWLVRLETDASLPCF